jgi:uncharacterized protein YbjT (DUF2867 family)
LRSRRGDGQLIFVTGATGNAGGAVVRALAAAGEPVRALVRGGADLPAGVEQVTGDLNRAETLRPHLEGVQAAFLLSGYDGLAETLAAMGEAGVRRVVLLSSSAAPSGDMTNAVARYHILSERAVRESGLAWTFLQPDSFMTNTFQWIPQLRAGDVVRAPFGDVRVATIDPDDVGAVAAAALTSSAHEGRTYRLSGPESLLPADRVATLARVVGRELRFEAQSDDEARAEMSESMPPEYVDAFMSFFADGTLDESEVLPTVREVTGREPRSFEAWARAHADAFTT